MDIFPHGFLALEEEELKEARGGVPVNTVIGTPVNGTPLLSALEDLVAAARAAMIVVDMREDV